MANDAPDIQDVLFPVELKPVFVEDQMTGLFSQMKKLPGFCAVIAVDTGHVFSVVAQNYKLITNEEALKLGETCFGQIFKLTDMSDMGLFNIIMPKTRSFCHVDYTHVKGKFAPFDQDSWSPYIRITNSYNRMFALNFDLGFCRGICKNGVIFGKKNIEFKFYHSHSGDDPEIQFKLRAGEFAKLEAQFTESLQNLKRYHVPKKFMWPLTCKVFDFKLPEKPTDRQEKMISERKQQVDELQQLYFSTLGENGYAALNVLTDLATRPVGVISPEGSIDMLQRRAGEWITNFVVAIDDRNFTFEEYLGDYARFAA